LITYPFHFRPDGGWFIAALVMMLIGGRNPRRCSFKPPAGILWADETGCRHTKAVTPHLQTPGHNLW